MVKTSRSRAGCSRNRLVSAAIAAVLLTGQAAAAAEHCPTAKEAAALRTRAVQTDFMMAALNCKERDRYNAFVKKFQKPLVRQGKALKAYFKRQHGGTATRELNAFITQLANLASQRYNKAPNSFCTRAGKQLTEVMALEPADFADFIGRQPVESAVGVSTATDAAKHKAACTTAAKTP